MYYCIMNWRILGKLDINFKGFTKWENEECNALKPIARSEHPYLENNVLQTGSHKQAVPQNLTMQLLFRLETVRVRMFLLCSLQ